MPRLVAFYMQRRLHFGDWSSDRIKREDVNEGCRNIKEGKAVRSVVDITVCPTAAVLWLRRQSQSAHHSPLPGRFGLMRYPC